MICPRFSDRTSKQRWCTQLSTNKISKFCNQVHTNAGLRHLHICGSKYRPLHDSPAFQVLRVLTKRSTQIVISGNPPQHLQPQLQKENRKVKRVRLNGLGKLHKLGEKGTKQPSHRLRGKSGLDSNQSGVRTRNDSFKKAPALKVVHLLRNGFQEVL